MSRGNILKAYLNFDFDDSIELRIEKENYVALVKVEYESTMFVLIELATQVDSLVAACRDHKKLLHICDEKEKILK